MIGICKNCSAQRHVRDDGQCTPCYRQGETVRLLGEAVDLLAELTGACDTLKELRDIVDARME